MFELDSGPKSGSVSKDELVHCKWDTLTAVFSQPIKSVIDIKDVPLEEGERNRLKKRKKHADGNCKAKDIVLAAVQRQ